MHEKRFHGLVFPTFDAVEFAVYFVSSVDRYINLRILRQISQLQTILPNELIDTARGSFVNGHAPLVLYLLLVASLPAMLES